MSQLLLADLVNVTDGDALFDESLEDLFAVVPFCTTEKERDVGENDNDLGARAKAGVITIQKKNTVKQNFNMELDRIFFLKKE